MYRTACKLILVFSSVCLCVCMMHVCAVDTCGDQKRIPSVRSITLCHIPQDRVSHTEPGARLAGSRPEQSSWLSLLQLRPYRPMSAVMLGYLCVLLGFELRSPCLSEKYFPHWTDFLSFLHAILFLVYFEDQCLPTLLPMNFSVPHWEKQFRKSLKDLSKVQNQLMLTQKILFTTPYILA